MYRSTRVFGLRCLLLFVGFGVAGVKIITPVEAQEMCGATTYPFPYTDVASVGAAFCPGIMEAYVTGVSKGTSPTTFSPNETVTRVQMTTFLQRSLDQGLTRAGRRAALNQWWTQQNTNTMQTIAIAGNPTLCAADGENIWVSNSSGGEVAKVQASTGTVLGTWTAAGGSYGLLAVGGKIYVSSNTVPGNLYLIDPTAPPGPVAIAADNLGNQSLSIAFDGTNIWTANFSGSVSIITPAATAPFPPGNTTTVSTGFSKLRGILYDGAHIWVTDQAAGTLLKLDAAGTILQTVDVGATPLYPVFDGANIWVPNLGGNSVTVVQASTGNVVATIPSDPSNLLSGPFAASFDGERILVANNSGSSVTLFKAADLSFIANVSTGLLTNPIGACSDGINFWTPLFSAGALLRF